MSLSLPWLSDANQQTLSALSALLDALETLRNDPKSPMVDWSDALGALIKALDEGSKPAVLNKADWDALSQEWAALKTALGNQLPAQLRPLTYKLSDLVGKVVPPATAAGQLSYPLVKYQGQGSQPLDYGFQADFASGAALNFNVETDEAAPDWATAAGYVHPAAEHFFRLGLQGSLTASASAKAAPSWGKVGVSASAQAAAYLDMCFNYPPSTYVAQALIRSLRAAPSPGDLASALAACKGQDFAIASLGLSGAAKLGVSVAAGTVLTSSLASGGLLTGVTVPVKLDASLTANWSLSGDYHLTVRQGDAGEVVARLERKRSRTAGWAFDLNAQLGIAGLDAALDPVLQQALPSADGVIAVLDQLSNLDALLRDKVLTALEQDGKGDWLAVAQAFLGGTGTPGEAAPTLPAALQAAFQKLASGYLDQGNGAVSKAVADIEAQFAGLLPAAASGQLGNLVAKASKAVTDALDKELTGLAKRLSDKLSGAVDDASKQLAGQLAAVLAAPSADVQKILAALKGAGAKVGAPLSQWVRAYQDARARIAGVIAEVQKRKLALDLAASYQRQRETGLLLEIAFSKVTDTSRSLYSGLWSGRMEALPSLLKAAIQEGSARELQGLLSQAQTTQLQHGFKLDVFGLLTVSATTTAMDKVAVSSDYLSGRVTAASDAISLKNSLTVNGALSEVGLDLALDMLAVPGGVPPLSAAFKGQGDKLTSRQIGDYFSVLESMGMAPTQVGEQVADFLFSGPAATGGNVASAAITGSFLLDAAGWTRLLAASPDAIYTAVQTACLDALTVAVANKVDRDFDQAPRAALAAMQADLGLTELQFWKLARASVRKDFEEAVLGGNGGSIAPNSRTAPARRFWELERIALGASRAWGELVQESTLLGQFLRGERTATEADFQQLADLSGRIAKQLRPAFDYPIPDTEQPIKVSWRYIGLLLGLGRVASNGAAPACLVQVLNQSNQTTRYFV